MMDGFCVFEQELTNLRSTYNIIKASNTALKAENHKSRDVKQQFEDEIHKLKQALQDQNDTMNILNDRIESLQTEKRRLEELTNSNSSLRDRNSSALSLADTQAQMEIFWSDAARTKGLYLCSCRVDINGKDMSFKRWLSTDINEDAMKLLWAKIEGDHCNAAKLRDLLTTTAMIYKTKCYQERTKSRDKPVIDSTNMKHYVEHLSVWIIRNHGIQTNDKRKVTVTLDNGKIKEEEVVEWKLNMSRDDFSNNISDWVDAYVTDQGYIENVL